MLQNGIFLQTLQSNMNESTKGFDKNRNQSLQNSDNMYKINKHLPKLTVKQQLMQEVG